MSSSNNNQTPQKKTKGRQKIKMEKIQNPTNLNITFSKRRANVFKKASELCTLCGIEAALVVYSPANKPYCFGHPNIEAVTERYLGESSNSDADADNNVSNDDPIEARCKAIMAANTSSNLRELNTKVTTYESKMRDEKTRQEELEAMKKMGRAQKWFPPPLEESNYEQLCALKESLLKFKMDFNEKAQRAIEDQLPSNNNSLPFHHRHHQFGQNNNHPSYVADQRNDSAQVAQPLGSNDYLPPPINKGGENNEGYFHDQDTTMQAQSYIPNSGFGDNNTDMDWRDQGVMSGFGNITTNYHNFAYDHTNLSGFGDQYGHINIAGSSSGANVASSSNAGLSFDPNNLGNNNHVMFGLNSNVPAGNNYLQLPFDNPNNLGNCQDAMIGSNNILPGNNHQLLHDPNSGLGNIQFDPNNNIVGNNNELPFDPSSHGR